MGESAGEGRIRRLLDEVRFGRAHRRVWVLSALGIMLDGFDFFIMGVALPLLVHEWGIDPLQTGMVSSAAIVGAMIGAAVMGKLADRIGRKLAFRLDLGMFVVFAVASAFAPDIWWLIAFRFLLGIGIGADYPIASSYVAEISPRRLRSRLLVGAFSFQAVGQLLGALVGLGVLALDPGPDAWRWMLAAGVVPAIAIVILRRGVPESPVWLASTRRYGEAAESLTTFSGRVVTVQEVREVSEPEAVAGVVTPLENRAAPGARRSIFSRSSRGATILTSVPWFLMDIATYGVGLFTPTIIATLAISSAASGNDFLDADITSTEGNAVLDVFLIVGFLAAILLVRRLGLIVMQAVGFLAMGAGLTLLAFTITLPQGSTLQLALLFTGFAVFNLCMNAGPNSTTFALPAIAFDTELRGAGAGFAAASGKAGAAVGTFFFPILQAEIGLLATLLLIAGGCVIAAVLTVALRHHARGGLVSDNTVVITAVPPATAPPRTERPAR
jgi:MFS family permease